MIVRSAPQKFFQLLALSALLQNPKYTTSAHCTTKRLDGSTCCDELAVHASYTWVRIPMRMGHHSDEFQPIVSSLRTWLLDGENLEPAIVNVPRTVHTATARKGTKFAIGYSSVDCAVSVYARASLLA